MKISQASCLVDKSSFKWQQQRKKGNKKYPFPIQINSTNQSPRNCIPKKGICLSLKRYIYLHIFLPYLSYISIHIICIRPLSVDVHEGYDVFAPLHTNLIYVSNLIQNFLLLPLFLIVQVRSKQVNLCQVRSTQFQLSFLYSAVVSAQVSYCLSPAASRQLFSQSAASAWCQLSFSPGAVSAQLPQHSDLSTAVVSAQLPQHSCFLSSTVSTQSTQHSRLSTAISAPTS